MPVLVGSPFKHPSLLRCKVICPPERSIDILYTAFINPIPMGKGIDPQTAKVMLRNREEDGVHQRPAPGELTVRSGRDREREREEPGATPQPLPSPRSRSRGAFFQPAPSIPLAAPCFFFFFWLTLFLFPRTRSPAAGSSICRPGTSARATLTCTVTTGFPTSRGIRTLRWWGITICYNMLHFVRTRALGGPSTSC